MKRAYIWAAIFSVLGVGLSSLAFFGAPMPLETRIVLSLSIGTTLLYTGAATVFLLALRGYKYRLKVAYRYICASMFLVSLGTLQFLFLGAMDAIDSVWVVQGGANLPFVLMATFAYLGVRIFAKLVGVESTLVNAWAGLGMAVSVGVLTAITIGQINTSYATFDASTAMDCYQTVILAITAILMFKIRRLTGPLYSSALRWSSTVYLILTIGGLAAVLLEPVLAADHWYNVYNVGTTPYFIGGLCVMVAALYFNRVAYAENINSAPVSAALNANQGPVTPVDVVVFLAGFASNMNRLDPILDEIRLITASLGPDKRLTDAQQQTLAIVYLKIEDFLIKNEAVRQYKQNDLRQMVELRFHEIADGQFWRSVQASPGRPVSSQGL